MITWTHARVLSSSALVPHGHAVQREHGQRGVWAAPRELLGLGTQQMPMCSTPSRVVMGANQMLRAGDSSIARNRAFASISGMYSQSEADLPLLRFVASCSRAQ